VADNVRSWVEGGRGFMEARFRADAGGVRQAHEIAAKLASDGFTVIGVHQTGGHLNASRSIATSLVGLSLLKPTGFGFLHVSRDPGQIVVTFEKTGPSQAEVAERERLAVAARRSAATTIAEHAELHKTDQSGPHGRVEVVRSSQMPSGARLFLHVSNTDSYDWSAYELEVVAYRPRDGATVATFKHAVKHRLRSGESETPIVPIRNLPEGDIGVLAAVTRVRVGVAWR
jgi:hypothetical protein